VNGFFRRNAVIAVAEILGRVPLVFTAGYVANSLGPRVYGSWALVITFSGLLISVVGLGLPVAVSRFASVASAGLARSYLRLALVLSLGAIVPVAALTALAMPWLAEAIGLPHGVAWLLLLGCLIAGVSGVEALLDAYFKSREAVGRQTLFVVSRSCIEVASILLVFGRIVPVDGLHGTKLLLPYALLNSGLKLVVYPWLVLVRAPEAEPAPRGDRRTFLRYGVPMIPAGIVVFLSSQGDRLVLGHAFSKHDLGIYAFGSALATYMTYLGYAINPLFLPRASVLYDAGDVDGVRRLFRQSQQVYLALFAFALCTLILFAPEIIDFTAGRAYGGSKAVLVVLSAAVGLEGLLGIYQWIFHLVRRPTLVLWFNIGYMAANIVAVIVAASQGGPSTVALAVLATVVTANVVRYLIARRQLHVPIERATVAGLAVLGAGLVPTSVAAAQLSVAARLGVLGLLLLVLAAGALAALRRLAPGRSVPVAAGAPPAG
jgi:O-antigen/teichoic acid export membrane protein